MPAGVSVGARPVGWPERNVAAETGMLGFAMALVWARASHRATVHAEAPCTARSEVPSALTPDIADRVATDVPLGRIGGTADAAAAVLFLLRRDCVTATVPNASGGRQMGLRTSSAGQAPTFRG